MISQKKYWFACSRFALVAYEAIAVYGFSEACKLLANKESDMEDGTLFVPFRLCDPGHDVSMPGDIMTGGNVVYDPFKLEDCRILSFVIVACASSLLLSAAALILYAAYEAFGKRRSTAIGMGVLLLFSMVQTVLSTWSLAREVTEFEEHVDKEYARIGLKGSMGIEDIRTYSNTSVLWAAGAAAIFVSILVIIDLQFIVASRKPEDDDEDGDDKEGSLSFDPTIPVKDDCTKTATHKGPQFSSMGSKKMGTWGKKKNKEHVDGEGNASMTQVSTEMTEQGEKSFGQLLVENVETNRSGDI